jgi:serine protease Do
MEIDHGPLVLGIDAGSPAAAAGLRPGDVIIEFAGELVSRMEDLLAALRQTDPGQHHRLVFIRSGDRQQVSVAIASYTG